MRCRHCRQWVWPLLWACLVLVSPQPAVAQTMPPAVIAVIDYQRIMREADAAVLIREQVDGRRDKLLNEIVQVEQELLTSQSELEKQRTVLSDEAYQEKRAEIDAQVIAFQRDGLERRQQIDQALETALDEVRNEILRIVDALSDQRQFNIVLPSTQVLLFEPELDLTDEILAAINQSLPSVDVPRTAE